MISLRLPFPPSVNGLFRDGSRGSGKRPKTNRYLAWEKAADGMALEQRAHNPKDGPRLTFIAGPVNIFIGLSPPDKRRRDCSNYIKAVEDWLVSREYIEGDDSRFVRKVSVSWADIEPGVSVEVWAV